jgi:hypothetical protein
LLFKRLDRPDFEDCTLLAAEQNTLRSTKFWWKNVYCPDRTCSCAGLSGSEVDIFMVFENTQGKRLALHVDCKNPDDTFKKSSEGADYNARAKCWLNATTRPDKVLPHDEALTLFLTDRMDRHAEKQLAAFDHRLTFDWVGAHLAPYPDPDLRYHGAAATWTELSKT